MKVLGSSDGLNQGLFIAFEGIDGSGKSTQIKYLHQKLAALGYEVVSTFEPTHWECGQLIRSIFLSKTPAQAETVAALFVADRLEHLLRPEKGLLAELNKGKIVLCDRYILSSLAYQGAHLPMDWVMEINQKPAQIRCPDISIYLEISPEQSLERIQTNRNQLEIYETLDNLKLVENCYRKAMEKHEVYGHLLRINATQNPELVAEEVWKKLLDFLPK